jgi:hypothetical protein
MPQKSPPAEGGWRRHFAPGLENRRILRHQLYQAWRKNVTGIVPSPLAFFWGVSKSAQYSMDLHFKSAEELARLSQQSRCAPQESVVVQVFGRRDDGLSTR